MTIRSWAGQVEWLSHGESMLANSNGYTSYSWHVFWFSCVVEVCEIVEVQGQRFCLGSSAKFVARNTLLVNTSFLLPIVASGG